MVDDEVIVEREMQGACALAPALEQKSTQRNLDLARTQPGDKDLQPLSARALHEVIDFIAQFRPSLTAAVDTETLISYADLADISSRLAQDLLCRGVASLCERPLGTLLRRGCRWLAVYFSAMRCGIPVLPLSQDLHDRAAEDKRNLEALCDLSVQLLIYGDAQCSPSAVIDKALQAAASFSVPTVLVDELFTPAACAAGVQRDSAGQMWPSLGADALLAYCYTGGTTGASKAVRISHAMALHEVQRYAEVLPEGLCFETMRFLQNSSAFWGAALLGQVDVALAMQGTVVMCEASLPLDLVEAIRRFGITAFGAVPSVLAHFTPMDVPSVRCVISWAEVLPVGVAARWSPALPLRDLLIATEYFLALYSAREDGCSFRVVGGVDVRILIPETTDEANNADIGELCIAGATVSPGYANPADNVGRFVVISGQKYFRTRDLVRWVGSDHHELEYCGRCDNLAKIGGKWEDLCALEAAVQGVNGVRESKLCFGAQHRRAFLVLEACSRDFAAEAVYDAPEHGREHPAEAIHSIAPKLVEVPLGCKAVNGIKAESIESVRHKLPPGTGVYIIAAEKLPRHPATGKVDQRALQRAVEEEDLTGVMTARRCRVAFRMLRGYRCAAELCHRDPRRMLCCAYIWYALMFCHEYFKLNQILSTHFHLQGGTPGAIFGMAWAAPLQQLQRLAAPGAAHARAAGRGLEWVVVFWATVPHCISSVRRWRKNDWFATRPDKAVERAGWSLQAVASEWTARACSSCEGMYAVTSFPSISHCCNTCRSSAGRENDPRCLRLPVRGMRKCDHCDFAVTWDMRFCCYACEKRPGRHGRHCNQQSFVVDTPKNGLSESFDHAKTNVYSGGGDLRSDFSHTSASTEGGTTTTAGGAERVDGQPGFTIMEALPKNCLELNVDASDIPMVDDGTHERCEGTGVSGDVVVVPPPAGAGNDQTRHGARPVGAVVAKRDVPALGAGVAEQELAAVGSGILDRCRSPMKVDPESKRDCVAATGEAAEQRAGLMSRTVVDKQRDLHVSDNESNDSEGAEPAAPPDVEEAAVAALVMKIAGQSVSPATPAGGLASLDSLRSLQLLAAIRQEFRRTLTVRDIADCGTTGQLAERIRSVAPEASLRRLFPAPGREGFRLWTYGWNSCLHWLFRCRQPFNPNILRAALTRLVRRHPALRLRFRESLKIQTHFMEAAVVLDLLRVAISMSPTHFYVARSTVAVVEASLKACWPRWHTALVDADLLDTIFVEKECASFEIQPAVQRLEKEFSPPFQLALLHQPELDEGYSAKSSCGSSMDYKESSSFHILAMLSHAIADGTAIVPFLHDLSQLCTEEELVSGQSVGGSLLKGRLPALPHFGAILEDRLLRSLGGDESWEDLMYLDLNFFRHHFPESSCRGYSQGFTISAGEVVELRHVADTCAAGCPIEVALLAVVVLSLARINGDPRVRLTLVHHGRDRPQCAANVVGFFTDLRTIAVPTSELVSSVGVLSYVAATIRERSWRRPLVLEPIDVLVNVVPSPFGQVGDFVQVPLALGRTSTDANAADVWQDSMESKTLHLSRQVELHIQQANSDEWTVTMYLDEVAYPREKGLRFRAAWKRAVRDLQQDPLRGVLDSAAAPLC